MQVQAGQRNRPGEGIWSVMAACPASPHPSPNTPVSRFATHRYPERLASGQARVSRQAQDGFLRFLEGYAARLAAGGESHPEADPSSWKMLACWVACMRYSPSVSCCIISVKGISCWLLANGLVLLSRQENFVFMHHMAAGLM